MKTERLNNRQYLPVIVGMVLSLLFFIVSCSKSNSGYGSSSTMPVSTTSLAVTNASPGTASYDVFSDTTKLSTSGQLGYGMTSGAAGTPYYAMSAGPHVIRLTPAGGSNAVDTNFTFQPNQNYSLFAFDTLNQGKLKTLILSDNLTAPPSGDAEVRFLPLSSNAGAINVSLIMGADTTAMTNLVYAGDSTSNVDSLTAFKPVPAGTYKAVINSYPSKNLLLEDDSVSFQSGKIYTLYLKGMANTTGADSLSLGTIQHN